MENFVERNHQISTASAPVEPCLIPNNARTRSRNSKKFTQVKTNSDKFSFSPRLIPVCKSISAVIVAEASSLAPFKELSQRSA